MHPQWERSMNRLANTFVLVAMLSLLLEAQRLAAASPAAAIAVQIYEGIPVAKTWPRELPEPSFRYSQQAFAFVGIPKKYNTHGVIDDRSNPLLLRARATIRVTSSQAGRWQLLVRAKNGARLRIDGELAIETPFMTGNGSGHEAVPELANGQLRDLRPLPPGCQEASGELELSPGDHLVELDLMVGGKGLRLELAEGCVAVARDGGPFKLLTATGPSTAALTEQAWLTETAKLQAHLSQVDQTARREASQEWTEYWEWRHEVASELASSWTDVEIPPAPSAYPVNNVIDRFVGARLAAADVEPAELTDDYEFIRRLALDTLGLLPTRPQIAALVNDSAPNRRQRAVERMLAERSWADHWVSYWQDVLAENPGILKPKLNNSGPFRWWIHESFLDNKPLDRFVTELVLMEGSKYYGGPAGFGMATQNDVPTAAKAHVLAKAFLGIEMKCARCHDAPYHPYKQQQLFSIAAMLQRQPLELPKTSTVPTAAGARKPLIEVTLKPGDTIGPAWPFSDLVPGELADEVLPPEDRTNPRARLAASFTSPHNLRFAKVAVNRLWKRYFGRGLVDPVDDWQSDDQASHPELLRYLAQQFVVHGYDLKHIARLILNSHAYQRRTVAVASDEAHLFASPIRRRLTAEQLVDSLYAASGKSFSSEPLTLDPEGRRSVETFLNLGAPTRAWQFTSLSNERDRPALALPVAQSILDLLVTFGWRDSRPNPLTDRDETATVLQPLIMANGVAARRAVCLSDDSSLTQLCVQPLTLPELIDQVYLQIVSRPPNPAEKALFVELLADGYEGRVVSEVSEQKRRSRPTAVSWSNHLNAEATKIKLELERAVLAGDPPTARLESNWRERMEDMAWALFNSPEFVFVP